MKEIEKKERNQQKSSIKTHQIRTQEITIIHVDTLELFGEGAARAAGALVGGVGEEAGRGVVHDHLAVGVRGGVEVLEEAGEVSEQRGVGGLEELADGVGLGGGGDEGVDELREGLFEGGLGGLQGQQLVVGRAGGEPGVRREGERGGRCGRRVGMRKQVGGMGQVRGRMRRMRNGKGRRRAVRRGRQGFRIQQLLEQLGLFHLLSLDATDDFGELLGGDPLEGGRGRRLLLLGLGDDLDGVGEEVEGRGEGLAGLGVHRGDGDLEERLLVLRGEHADAAVHGGLVSALRDVDFGDERLEARGDDDLLALLLAKVHRRAQLPAGGHCIDEAQVEAHLVEVDEAHALAGPVEGADLQPEGRVLHHDPHGHVEVGVLVGIRLVAALVDQKQSRDDAPLVCRVELLQIIREHCLKRECTGG